MLENLNDYISFVVMTIIVIISLRLFIASLVYKEGDEERLKGKRNRILFGYSDNEDE